MMMIVEVVVLVVLEGCVCVERGCVGRCCSVGCVDLQLVDDDVGDRKGCGCGCGCGVSGWSYYVC